MTENESSKRILIIDDDELNAKAFAKRLERRGFVLTVITNGSMALEVIEKEQINLVILDIVMPEIDGLSVLKQIRTKHAMDDLPVIMLTSLDDSSDVFNAFESGANDYITKPANIDAAASRIKSQLSAVELRFVRTKKKEIQAINALVVTYNHEINNPLAIARSELQSIAQDHPQIDKKRLEVIDNSFDRIMSILQKIKDLAENSQISYELYANKSKMLKIKE
jgi:DNA-binding response OmpR family regulator